MLHFYKKSLLLLLFISLLLTGCYDITMRTDLKADNTGTREFIMILDLPTEMRGKEAGTDSTDLPTTKLMDNEGLHLISEETETLEDGRKLFKQTYEFDYLEAFNDSNAVVIVENEGNEIYIKEIHNQSMTDEDDKSAKEEDKETEMMKRFFRNYNFVYEITMPGEIIESNADEVDGNKAIWRCDLGEYLTNEFVIEIRSKKK